MEVIQALVETMQLDYALCSGLGYLYSMKPDWFSEHSLMAIVDKGNRYYIQKEFNNLTGGRFHGRIVRNLLDDSIQICIHMLDKRCDEYTYTKVFDYYWKHINSRYYSSFIRLVKRHFREMKEMGYKRKLTHFQTIIRVDKNFKDVRELLRDMISENPEEPLQVRELFMLAYKRAWNLKSVHSVILEARAYGMKLYADVEKCHKVNVFLNFMANRDVLFELLENPSDAYQLLLLDPAVDLQGVLLLVREARSMGFRVNPVAGLGKRLPTYWCRSKKDGIALDILREADFLDDAAIAGLTSVQDNVLKLILRNETWSEFPKSIEAALLRHTVKLPGWLSKALPKSKVTQEDVLRALHRGHVATALHLLSKRCDEKTFEAVFREAVNVRVLVKTIASKKVAMRGLGYKVLKKHF